MVMPVVVGRGVAVPPTTAQDDLWQGYFSRHYADDRRAGRLFSAAGVRRRHAVVDPLVEDCSSWSTGRRMERFRAEALPLGLAAVSAALADAGTDASEVGLLTVATCTGYSTPGLDVLVARDLAMAADVQRLAVGHMGCYAALPALATVGDYVVAHERPAVLLCVELTSLHLQPGTAPGERLDVEQVVSHALFSDAAAAVVVRPAAPDRQGLAVLETRAVTDVDHVGSMTWDVTDLGFRMGLAADVPDVLARHVRGAVEGLLAAHGLAVADVAGWAVHPGGPRILDVVRDQLGLDETAMASSRAVLAEDGNCSSATVLLVLDRLRRDVPFAPGDAVVALAFGPGLTLYATLLRAT